MIFKFDQKQQQQTNKNASTRVVKHKLGKLLSNCFRLCHGDRKESRKTCNVYYYMSVHVFVGSALVVVAMSFNEFILKLVLILSFNLTKEAWPKAIAIKWHSPKGKLA